MILAVGQTVKLGSWSLTGHGQTRAVANATWFSTNVAVATVPAGPAATVLVTAVAAGNVRIYAQVGGQISDSLDLTVIDPPDTVSIGPG